MARLSTAAAGLAWAAILLTCAALVAGQGDFIKDTLPPPVRIYCRQDPVLNIAVSRDGEVVLARATCSDLRQKWHLLPGAASMPFALMNAATGQVITIPSSSGRVGLSSRSNPSDGAQALPRDQWMQEEPTRRDRFSRLLVNRNQKFTLIAERTQQGGGVQVGSLIRISSSASATATNALWQLTSYPLCVDPNNPNPNP